ncbi:MAG: hypothetical protein A3F12_02095 [Gammaproteobacteria bacterium RIFCSPHIGHO2_12_FULL_38_14]|nr:MAG: hypothetical protein A3F12_02095 [Gammaproteobacteria bacterium RIFCSPHIGHO2_12_FULL_38_14]
MSDGCCSPEQHVAQQKNVLMIVLIINSVMFLVQASMGILARSTSLLADSTDMLADAIAYAISLYAAGRGGRWLAKAALIKGIIITSFGIIVLLEASYKMIFGSGVPYVEIMAIFSGLGLVANTTCFYLLTRHREANINMHSAWICARNDMIANCSVLIAAGLVALTHSRWPDIIIGLMLVCVLLYSGTKVIKSALRQLSKVLTIK